MKHLLLTAFIAFAAIAPAAAQVEPEYDPGKPPATTPWYEWIDEAGRQADLKFIAGMRPHHAGALTMSDEYLSDGEPGASPHLSLLAKAIIHNQKFEIGMLDTIEAHLKNANVPAGQKAFVRTATRGLAQKQRFLPKPDPSFLNGPGSVNKRDVQFAKAMIVHHEGALVMCDDYLQNPASRNGYLELMCLDILLDQKQEIALMHDIIADYPGNPDDVKITPDMIHGMDGMEHRHHH